MATEKETALQYMASFLDVELKCIYKERKSFVLLVMGTNSSREDIINFERKNMIIENGNREDIIKAMREAADKLENNEAIPVGGEQ